MEIWIGRDGERHGPYAEVDVRQWLRDGKVSGADLGWHEGVADWQPLSVLLPDADDHPAADADQTAIAAPIPPPIATTREAYAGFWQRFGAWVIDLLVLIIPYFILFYALHGPDAFRSLMEQMQAHAGASAETAVALREYSMATMPIAVIWIFIGFAYYALFECSNWQATPGKRALHLRVTTLEGQRLTLARSAARNAVRLVNLVIWVIPFASYLAVAWTPRKQGLHDLLARTLVLNDHASEFDHAQPPNSGSFSA